MYNLRSAKTIFQKIIEVFVKKSKRDCTIDKSFIYISSRPLLILEPLDEVAVDSDPDSVPVSLPSGS